jgi:hypothetical protein
MERYKLHFINKNIYKNSMSKLLLIVTLMCLLVLPTITAIDKSISTVQKDKCINLFQICDNCTYVNITSIIGQGTVNSMGSGLMTKTGTYYNYTFCGTSSIGTYIYNTCGDLNGVLTCEPVSFEVTPSGFSGTLGFSFLIILVLGAIAILGFYLKDGWFVVFSGLGLIGFGIYSFINGIAGFKDTLVTQGTALFFIGIGAYLAINSGIQMIDEGFE